MTFTTFPPPGDISGSGNTADGHLAVWDGLNSSTIKDGGVNTVGTVTSVSVVSANGFSGTVATATTTPAITIIPLGETLLASVQADCHLGTKQTLYTVPAAKKCIITKVIVRSASASLGAMGDDMTFGFDGGASDWNLPILASTLTGLTTAAFFVTQSQSAGATFSAIGAAAGVFGCSFVDTSINADVTVDVFGYLF